MHWIWFIVVGFVVGVLGRLLHRGRDPMGWLLTLAIGVVSMVVAAAISSGWLLPVAMGVVSMVVAAAISSGWLVFVIGVVVAVALVAIVGPYRGGRPLAHA